MTTTIQKWGNSSAIRLPKGILSKLNLNNSDSLDIEIQDNNIILTKVDRKKHITLANRLKNYNGNEYASEEWETGTFGKEVL